MTASELSRVSVVFCRESYTWDLNYAACSVLMVIAGGDLMLQIWGDCVCKHLAHDVAFERSSAARRERGRVRGVASFIIMMSHHQSGRQTDTAATRWLRQKSAKLKLDFSSVGVAAAARYTARSRAS